jgi:hypothetical protein
VFTSVFRYLVSESSFGDLDMESCSSSFTGSVPQRRGRVRRRPHEQTKLTSSMSLFFLFCHLCVFFCNARC